MKCRVFAEASELVEVGEDNHENIPWRDAFPEFKENEAGANLAGYRHREGLTQVQYGLRQGADFQVGTRAVKMSKPYELLLSEIVASGKKVTDYHRERYVGRIPPAQPSISA